MNQPLQITQMLSVKHISALFLALLLYLQKKCFPYRNAWESNTVYDIAWLIDNKLFLELTGEYFKDVQQGTISAANVFRQSQNSSSIMFFSLETAQKEWITWMMSAFLVSFSAEKNACLGTCTALPSSRSYHFSENLYAPKFCHRFQWFEKIWIFICFY